MPKKKKRPLAPRPSVSLKRARQITSAFHNATRALDGALAKGDEAAAASARAAVEAAGGREAYQAASAAATARHRVASKFVWSHLTRLGFREEEERKRTRKSEKPRVLEIGAINTQLLSTPWLRVRSVDLRAPPGLSSEKGKRIEALDFFDVSRLPQRNEFDAVVCSMVLNCLTAPEQRGEMLRGIRRHLRFDEGEEEEEKRSGGGGDDGSGDEGEEAGGNGAVAEKEEAQKSRGKNGIAFIMLPRRCVEASRACDWQRFERCLAQAGLGDVVARKASAKVAFWCLRATKVPSCSSSSSSSSEGEDDSALIAAAHAAGDFAVSMKGAGAGAGGGEKKKNKGAKKEKGGRS